PAVLGSEIAGELEDGTRVMAITSGAGGYAELVAVDRAQVVPLPEHASFVEGASFLLTFLTAYIPLTRQVRVRPGSNVLVYAAAARDGGRDRVGGRSVARDRARAPRRTERRARRVLSRPADAARAGARRLGRRRIARALGDGRAEAAGRRGAAAGGDRARTRAR